MGHDLARPGDRRAAPGPRHGVVPLPGRQDRGGASLLPQRQAQPQRRPDRVRPRRARLHGPLTVAYPYSLPPDLPVPVDDGATDHLPGAHIPRLELPTTDGHGVELAEAAAQLLVLYVYPRTGKPGEEPIPGLDASPGARGCTPQACPCRDHHAPPPALSAPVRPL